MTIYFRTLLADAGLEPKTVKVLRHTIDRTDLFAVWRNDRAAFETYQSIQQRKSRSYFVRPWWASFIALKDGRTCFVGMYRSALVGPVPEGFGDVLSLGPANPAEHDHYECVPADELGEFAGRLFIEWVGRNWRQNGESAHAVVELARAVRDPEFPGPLEFIRPLSDIAYLPEGWLSHLRQGKGVYLLTCPKTREQYVGKADGEDGFLGRWLNYVATGHGGNVRLRSRDPSDYQVCILEFAGSSATPKDIATMEERWKRKLQSRDMGLNAN
jgi:hypothetical protein